MTGKLQCLLCILLLSASAVVADDTDSRASTAPASSATVALAPASNEGRGRNEFSAVAITQLTRPSIGLGYGTVSTWQSSKISFGGSVEYRLWHGNNGIAATYSVVASDASFSAPSSIWSRASTWQMSLTRHEGVLSYVRRFSRHRRFKPYAEIGAGGFVTHGGFGWRLDGIWQNNSYLGTDGQFEVRAATGFDWWHSRHFGIRTGYVVHWFRAPNTGDPNYNGARTLISEPQIGLLWTF